jgi:hypothetical protein
MSDAARRKEKQRLKRDKKKAASRRAAAVSPYKRIGQTGELDACYINANWKESGMAQIQVIRRNPLHGYTLAAFLIDIWCAGLKDTFGRLDLIRDEIDHQLDRARDHFELVRIDVETARNFVASAIRFARQNGFRLPQHYDRWTKVLGGELNVETADLNGFGKDGKLRWVGPLDDLQKRLVNCSVDDFLKRPDVDFISEIQAPDEFDTEEDEDDELFDQLVDSCRAAMEATAKIANNLAANQRDAGDQIPEPILAQASRLVIAYQMHEAAERRLGENIDEIEAQLADAQMQAASELRDEVVAEFPDMQISQDMLDELSGAPPSLPQDPEDADFAAGLRAFIQG